MTTALLTAIRQHGLRAGMPTRLEKIIWG
jgi:hypothetical protein